MARPKNLGLEHTWRLRLRRQAASGLSIAALCRREDVSSAVSAWRNHTGCAGDPAKLAATRGGRL
jgi:hypothetical protein